MAERSLGRSLKRVSLVGITLVVVIATTGYLLFNWMRPLTTEKAVELFHARNDGVTSGSYEVDLTEASGPRTKRLLSERAGDKFGDRDLAFPRGSDRGTDLSPSGTHQVAASGSTTSFDVMPAEGVYMFEGNGIEDINGIKRDFPSESHRIITHEDRDTWQEHHVFGEDRESWTRITTGDAGRFVHSQRHLIGIAGQIVRDTNAPFHPPLHAVRFPLRSDGGWSGRFEGRSEPDGDDYTGRYRVHVLGKERWVVGSTAVRVFGYEMDAEFEGELEATVTVRYWFAPSHGITVHEYYSIDAKVKGLDYHAEWDVRLLSLVPRT